MQKRKITSDYMQYVTDMAQLLLHKTEQFACRVLNGLA